MGKIKSFKIEMRPFTYYGSQWYEMTVEQNNELVSVSRVIAPDLPYEAEIETLARMGSEIVRGLRDKEKHGGCCDCCEEKKKCPKS